MSWLSLWTETRSIGAAQAFASAAPSDDTPLPDGRSARAHDAWMTCADRGDPAALPALLQAATAGTANQAATRLARLEQVEDPRIELALLRFLGEMPFRTKPTCNAFWHVVFDRLTLRGPVDADFAAIAATCRALGTNFAMAHARRVERLAEDVRAASRTLTEDERAQLQQLGFLASEEAEPEGPTIEALFDAVHANPENLDARAVLADALLSRDDPRGELIALQLALDSETTTRQYAGRTYTPHRDRNRDVSRQDELLAEHANAWLGPWVAAICMVQWRRGFPHVVSIDRKLAKAGKLVGQPALRTVERVEVLPHMWSANQRGGLRKALKSEVLSNVRSISKLYVADLKPLRKARAATLRDLTLELAETFDPDALAAELARWTALESLTLEVRPSMVQGEMPSLAALLSKLAIASITVSVQNPQGQAVPLDRLVAAAHPETQRVVVVPSYRTVLQTERENGRFTRATYRIDPPEHGTPACLVLGAWARAQQAFELTVDGPIEAVNTRAADLQFLPLLNEEVPALSTVEVFGPVEASQLTFDPPPSPIGTLTLHSDGVDTQTLAAVDALPVEELHLTAGRMRVRRGGSGGLNRCTLDWYSWRARGTRFEMLQRLQPGFRAVDWRHGDRPAELTGFLEEGRAEGT